MHLVATGLTSAFLLVAALAVGAVDAQPVGPRDARPASIACVDTLAHPWS